MQGPASRFDVDILEQLNLHGCGDSFVAIGNAQLASGILKAGAMPILLGGEHAAVLAETHVINKTLEGKYGLIWLDSHLDYWLGELFAGNEQSNLSPLMRVLNLEAFPCKNILHIGMRGTSNPRNEIETVKKD